MPIYTVRETTGDQKPHPELKGRGLDARVVTMTQLDPVALPDYPQVAYHLYSKLLPAFMVMIPKHIVNLDLIFISS